MGLQKDDKTKIIDGKETRHVNCQSAVPGYVGVAIEDFIHPNDQMCSLGSHNWSVPRLFEITKDLPVMDVPLAHLNIYYTYKKLTLREMVMHFKAVMSADLSFPIILDEDGELMDGRHRIMKAMFNGAETIKVVRFEKNPSPCKVDT